MSYMKTICTFYSDILLKIFHKIGQISGFAASNGNISPGDSPGNSPGLSNKSSSSIKSEFIKQKS